MGHSFFQTKNKKVRDFVNRFTEYNYYQHKVLSYGDCNYVPFPINRVTIKKVFGIEIPTFEINEFLKKDVEKSKFNLISKNFKDGLTFCFEYPKGEEEPYYIVMTNENMKKREQYMEEVKKLE